MPSPDIEIYLKDTGADAVLAWLATRFSDAPGRARPAGKRQWQLEVGHGGARIPVLVIEEASPGFVSLWFDSTTTPWPDDIACAREVHAVFGKEVRATPGSWQEGDDPDLWWRINAEGEGLVQWPG